MDPNSYSTKPRPILPNPTDTSSNNTTNSSSLPYITQSGMSTSQPGGGGRNFSGSSNKPDRLNLGDEVSTSKNNKGSGDVGVGGSLSRSGTVLSSASRWSTKGETDLEDESDEEGEELVDDQGKKRSKINSSSLVDEDDDKLPTASPPPQGPIPAVPTTTITSATPTSTTPSASNTIPIPNSNNTSAPAYPAPSYSHPFRTVKSTPSLTLKTNLKPTPTSKPIALPKQILTTPSRSYAEGDPTPTVPQFPSSYRSDSLAGNGGVGGGGGHHVPQASISSTNFPPGADSSAMVHSNSQQPLVDSQSRDFYGQSNSDGVPNNDSRTALNYAALGGNGAPPVGGIRAVDYAPKPNTGTGVGHYPPGEQVYTTVDLGGKDNGSTNNTKSHKKAMFANWGGGGGSKNPSGANTPIDEKDPRGRPPHSRASSWDRLRGHGHSRAPSREDSPDGTRTPGGTKRPGYMTPEWEGFEFNPSQSKIQELRFAEGDVGKSKLAKGYYFLLSKSIVTRWILYIFPVLALFWIPGIVWLAGARDARIWGTTLLYWSIWFTVLWAGWWGALAVCMLLPRIVGVTLGSIVPGLRSWVDVAGALVRNAALIVWAAAIWISFTPIIINQFSGDQTSVSRSNLSVFVNILFGIFLSSLVIGAEKLLLQIIAFKFHQDSYADRIASQKVQIDGLVTLYINSHDIIGRSDTLTDAQTMRSGGKANPKRAIRSALKGLRNAAQSTTTALGNVATEISGQSVLQTNSPFNKVNMLLQSANKSKLLARRLYYSFRKPGADHLAFDDVARYFQSPEQARAAFEIFDRDDNGDATRDEVDMAVLQIHREKLALEASVKDVDGAVRRLDDILMVIVLVIIILIMAAMVTTKLTTLVTSAGTFILGLSWLIGTTMQEILGCIIFLFVKHPFDILDKIEVDGNSFIVSQMNLMSTTLKRIDGTYTFIGNAVLKDKYIYNIRRSGPIMESFAFDVDFTTTFEKLSELREKMLFFLKNEKRDFLPIFDVVVADCPGQEKLSLKADIKYKTNWQEGALKVQRRNKWICALKTALADCEIYGPAGAGNPAPPPADPIAYTMVPYVAPPAVTTPNGSNANALSQQQSNRNPESPPPDFKSATSGGQAGAALLSREQVIEDTEGDIFGDSETTQSTPPHSAGAGFNVSQRRQQQQRAPVQLRDGAGNGENIELRRRI